MHDLENLVPFPVVATRLINDGLIGLREKKYLNGMADLDELAKNFDSVVQNISGNKIGIALLPSKKQSHPALTKHRFYVLSIVNDDRKQMLAALSVLAVPITGEYAIYFLDPDERPYGLGDQKALEAHFLQFCYIIAEKIFGVTGPG